MKVLVATDGSAPAALVQASHAACNVLVVRGPAGETGAPAAS